MNKSALILAGVIIIIFIFGAVQIINEYRIAGITGGVVSGDFNVEDASKAEAPRVVALLNTGDNKLYSDEIDSTLERDGNFVIVKPTTIPARKGDHYLFMEWNSRLMVLSLYMKKGDSGDSSFEIWGPSNKKIASGELTDEFRWYNFDVSDPKMSSESYALFNYGGGTSDIIIDKALGVPYPEGGLSTVTGLITR